MRIEGFLRLPLMGIFLAASKNCFIGNRCLAGKGKVSKSSMNGLGGVMVTLPFSIKPMPLTL